MFNGATSVKYPLDGIYWKKHRSNEQYFENKLQRAIMDYKELHKEYDVQVYKT